MSQRAWMAPDVRSGDRATGAPDLALVTQAKLLIVDDEESTRLLLGDVLRAADYSCATAGDSAEARAQLREGDFQLVLTDMNMPGESGLDLLGFIHEHHPQVAVVMVTGHDDAELAKAALDNGAYGYVIKPFTLNEILIAVANALRRRELEMAMRNQAARLERMVQERTAELTSALENVMKADEEVRASREDTIKRLAMAAEFRDFGTARHVARMSRYCALLSQMRGASEKVCDLIRVASLMHDVGKLGVPEEVLFKRGSLTPAEWAVMRKHTELGFALLSGSGAELLDAAATIALTHHERIDGTGYPHGLKGDEIPIEGRIAAMADVFDALTSDRVYRGAFSLTEARDLIRDGRGDHFDPEIVDLMMDGWPEIIKIYEEEAAPSA